MDLMIVLMWWVLSLSPMVFLVAVTFWKKEPWHSFAWGSAGFCALQAVTINLVFKYLDDFATWIPSKAIPPAYREGLGILNGPGYAVPNFVIHRVWLLIPYAFLVVFGFAQLLKAAVEQLRKKGESAGTREFTAPVPSLFSPDETHLKSTAPWPSASVTIADGREVQEIPRSAERQRTSE